MKMIKSLLFTLTLLFAGQIYAQDIHWSLFNLSPLTLNPAHTGDFNGTYRIGGIYRDQARSAIGGKAYSTPSIHVDAPILMVGKRNWIGIGANVYSDKAGSGALNTTSALLSAAFHAPLDRKATSVFSFGIQGGYIGQKLDNEDLTFESDYDLSTLELATNPSFVQKSQLEEDGNYYDFSAGAMIKAKMNKQTGMTLGLAVRHLTTPKYSLNKGNTTNTDSTSNSLPLRVNFHGQFDFALNKKWTLSPTFLYSQMKSSSNIQIQGTMGYLLNPEKDITLRFGAGYRMRDAAEILLGLDYKRIRIGASYDITLSDLNETNKTVGGFELGVSYIGFIFKKADVKPVILCPRF